MPFGTKEAFLAIEQDLLTLSRFIDFSVENLGVHSYELARLLVFIGSEIDIALKDICRRKTGKDKFKNITGYKKVLLHFIEYRSDDGVDVSLPLLKEETKVYMPMHRFIIWPWVKFTDAQSPDWWGSYNDVKHDRVVFYRDANLKNVLLSSAALFHLWTCLHHMERGFAHAGDNEPPESRLFDCCGQLIIGKKCEEIK